MPLPEAIKPCTYHPDDEQKKLTTDNITYITDFLAGYNKTFNVKVWDDLQEAIKDDNRVGRDFDGPNGNLYKRIQKYFWNKYSFNFVPMGTGKMDRLEEAIQRCREESLRFPIEVELSRRMDWDAGTFGDGESCYFGGNSCTRRFMNTQENFRTLKVYKDGKPFGRALLLTDVAGDDFTLLYNSYPGRNDKYKDMFGRGLAHALKLHSGVDYEVKIVRIENRSKDTGWFYTNENQGVLIYPVAKQAEADKTDRVILAYGDRPIVRRLPGYVSDCVCCTKDDGRHGSAIFDYDKYVQIPGTRVGAGICQKCSNAKDHCDICDKEVIAVTAKVFNVFQIPGIGVMGEKKEDNKQIFVCSSCFNPDKHRMWKS